MHCWWLRAVRAIYANVPMSVSAPGLEGRIFSSTQGLKQGCPLSPTLFNLYVADLEQQIMAAAARGEQLDLPQLSGRRIPPLMYADDCVLLSTSASGLQRQLDILERYCSERGLTVNLKKTKAMLLSGTDPDAQHPAKAAAAAVSTVRRARLTYAGGMVEAVPDFKYLGITFHCTESLGESAPKGRATVARFAASTFEGRCMELGLESTRLLLMLYDSLVDSTLSYAAAVWAPGPALAAAGRPVVGASGLSAAELQHGRTLRRLLGLPKGTPTATALAEAGQPPLHITWLASAARLCNTLAQAPEGSLLHTVREASLQLAADSVADEPRLAAARQPWARQLQGAMQAAGVAFDLREPPEPSAVRQAALSRYLQQVAGAAQQPDATLLRHYFVTVRPECLTPDGYGLPGYMTEVRERHKRRGLTEIRTGMHWGVEATERLLGRGCRPNAARICQHCIAAGLPSRVENAGHIALECTLYSDLRALHPTLFPPEQQPPSLTAFLAGPNDQLARFTSACRRRGRMRAGMPV